MSEPDTERTLVVRARDGDRGAFGQLVQLHMRPAYRVALGLVGSHDDALDLSQEAFIRAYRARETLDAERPFFAWLYQILRRLCLNHLRDGATRRGKLRESAHWLADEAHAAAPEDPARAAERAALRQRVRDGIDDLHEREREVLILREFEGLSYRDIAELVGIPEGTVMSRLYTARRALADRLGEDA